VNPDDVFDRIRAAFADDVKFSASPPVDDMKDRDGYFWQEDGRSRIWLRAGQRGIERLASLIYVLGHHLSYGYGWPEDYKDAIVEHFVDHWHGRPTEQRRAVIDEEVRAWRYGMRLAEQHGFDDHESLEKIAFARLEDYRARVDLADDEFDMVVASL